MSITAVHTQVDSDPDIGIWYTATTPVQVLRAHARQAKNRQLELDAAEIRIRANCRVGELMSGQGHKVGKAKPQQSASGFRQNPLAPPTLAEAGIDNPNRLGR